MLKAIGKKDGKDCVIFGLSSKNLEELTNGRPIFFDGRPYGVPMHVMILTGVDEMAIARQLGIDTSKISADLSKMGDVRLHLEEDAP